MAPYDPSRVLAALRRAPDVEAPELFAHDATDRLLVERALQDAPAEVTVVGDRYGAITAMLLDAGVLRVRVHQDSIVGERALRQNLDRLGLSTEGVQQLPLGQDLVAGASLVLVQLPRGLDALDEIAEVIARHAARDVTVVAGGRVKHMTLAMNEVLARHFREVSAGLAVQKSRLLTASEPTASPSAWPATEVHEDLGLTVVAHGAAFAGTAVDPGARMLIRHLGEVRDAGFGFDIACGTGVLAVALAQERPTMRVRASDVSAAAIDSARATAAANGVIARVDVERLDGTEGIAAGQAQVILLNPPFHSGAAVHTGIAERLIGQAGEALAPGGELWCVWNSHLRYRPLLDRIGPTRQADRDPRHTLTVTTKAEA